MEKWVLTPNGFFSFVFHSKLKCSCYLKLRDLAKIFLTTKQMNTLVLCSSNYNLLLRLLQQPLLWMQQCSDEPAPEHLSLGFWP